jgi:hypothetical protein
MGVVIALHLARISASTGSPYFLVQSCDPDEIPV